MDIYQHDGATAFRLVLQGKLSGTAVRDIQQAWITATSILAHKELVVNVSGVTNADGFGLDLLSRMRELGARLIAIPPPSPQTPDCRCGRLARFARLWFHIGTV